MMPPSSTLLELLHTLRQRLRELSTAELERVRRLSGVSRAMVYKFRALEVNLNPRLSTLVALCEALEVMGKDTTVVACAVPDDKYKCFPGLIEHVGAPIFLLCDTFALDTLRSGIDLDLMAYEAIIDLVKGRPLSTALGRVHGDHPGVPGVRQALAAMPPYGGSTA